MIQQKEAVPIKIGLMYLGFNVLTIIAVDCEDLEEWGDVRQSLRTFEDKDTINIFMEAINRLDTEIQARYPIDTRSKLFIHYDNKQIDTLCMNESFILKDGKHYRNDTTIVRMIRDIYGY